jgi:hypothetical protein
VEDSVDVDPGCHVGKKRGCRTRNVLKHEKRAGGQMSCFCDSGNVLAHLIWMISMVAQK